MSERLIVAAEALLPSEPGRDVAMPHLALVREAVTSLGWGTMTYRCEACDFEWPVWLSLGVEGPPQLRQHGLYVASPFTLSSCPSWPIKPDATHEDKARFTHVAPCAGRMAHVRFGDDREFAPCLIPDDAPRFVLDHWHVSAALVLPEPAIVRARRFHDERWEHGG